MNQLAMELCKTSLLLYETFGALELAQTNNARMAQEVQRKMQEALELQQRYSREIEEARKEAQNAKDELEVLRLLVTSFAAKPLDDEYRP